MQKLIGGNINVQLISLKEDLAGTVEKALIVEAQYQEEEGRSVELKKIIDKQSVLTIYEG